MILSIGIETGQDAFKVRIQGTEKDPSRRICVNVIKYAKSILGSTLFITSLSPSSAVSVCKKEGNMKNAYFLPYQSMRAAGVQCVCVI